MGTTNLINMTQVQINRPCSSGIDLVWFNQVQITDILNWAQSVCGWTILSLMERIYVLLLLLFSIVQLHLSTLNKVYDDGDENSLKVATNIPQVIRHC